MNTSSKSPCQLLKEQAEAALEDQRNKIEAERIAKYDRAFSELKKTFPLLESTNRYDVARLCGDYFLIDYEIKQDFFKAYLGYHFYHSYFLNRTHYFESFNDLIGYARFLEWKKKNTFLGIRLYQKKPY